MGLTDSEVNAAREAWRLRDKESISEVAESLGIGLKTFTGIIRGTLYADVEDVIEPLHVHDEAAKAYWKERKDKRHDERMKRAARLNKLERKKLAKLAKR